jgi:hypothetical protein
LEGRKRRRIELKPHILSLPASCDDGFADDGSFEVGARDTVDDFGIIGNDAFGDIFSDAVVFNRLPRRLYLR